MAENFVMFGAGGCCCLALTVFIIVFFTTSIARVDTTEWCLKYSWWSESVADVVYTDPGMVWVGMGNHLIPYPNYNMYVYFRDFGPNTYQAPGDIYQPPLQVRTKDGLKIQLELEFVYRLQDTGLRDQYLTVGPGGYEDLLTTISEGVVDNAATTYTAQEFYLDRKEMRITLFNELTKRFNASSLAISIQSLQLQPAIFPYRYSQAIVDTLDAKQDIQVAEQEVMTAEIVKETELQVARTNAEKIRMDSWRDANITLLNTNITVETFVYTQKREAEGYARNMEFFSEQGAPVPNFMEYLNVRALADHTSASKTVQVASLG